MSPSNRQSLLLSALAILLLATALWSYGQLARSRKAAVAAVQDLRMCQALVPRLEALKRRPTLVGLQELPATDLTQHVEQAAQRAAMPISCVIRISPEAARRLGDTVYKEKPTQILLRQVTLRQLAAFFLELTKRGSGLQVKSLRLSAPREQESGEGWTAEATVSHVIYSPRHQGNEPESAY